MNNLDETSLDMPQPDISRRSFMLRASALATSAALLTLSPTGRVLASWATGPGEQPEAVGRLLLQNNRAFNGERRDPVTGLYHLGQGYRAYNPRMMRFNAADSLSPFGEGGINPYVYCLGDPINAVDPTGHLSWQAWLGIGLSILGIIISIATLGIGIKAGIALNFVGAALIASSVLGVASGALSIASAALESSNPELSANLGWAALGLGIGSAVIGIANLAATIRTVRLVGSRVPKYLYRGDTRPPHIIGRSGGFKSAGTNRSIVTHLSGSNAVYSGLSYNRSAYISFSASRDTATNCLIQRVASGQAQTGFVYKVQSSGVKVINPSTKLRSASHRSLVNRSLMQQEFLVDGVMPYRNIISARPL